MTLVQRLRPVAVRHMLASMHNKRGRAMNEGYWIAPETIIVAGVAISTQAPINVRSGRVLGDGLTAAARVAGGVLLSMQG